MRLILALPEVSPALTTTDFLPGETQGCSKVAGHVRWSELPL